MNFPRAKHADIALLLDVIQPIPPSAEYSQAYVAS